MFDDIPPWQHRQLNNDDLYLVENSHRNQATEPLYFAIRLNTITVQNQQDIEHAFAAVERSNIQWEHPTHRHQQGQDPPFEANIPTFVDAVGPDNPVLHLGVWDRQANGPRVTASTIQAAKGAAAQEAVLRFLATVDRALGPTREKLKEVDPRAVVEVMGINTEAEYQELGLDPELVERVEREVGGRVLGFGQLGTTMAAIRGAGTHYHLDPNDHTDHVYTVVIPISPAGWDTAQQPTCHVEFPQLKLRMPLRPGQVLAFRASNLVHRVTPINPEYRNRRLALTLFTCRFVGRAAQEKLPEQPKSSQRKRKAKSQIKPKAKRKA